MYLKLQNQSNKTQLKNEGDVYLCHTDFTYCTELFYQVVQE